MRCYFIGGEWDAQCIEVDADNQETFGTYERWAMISNGIGYYIYAVIGMHESSVALRARELIFNGGERLH